ncbi:MAG TPA: sulfatase [Candidatus Dormibacteraeota bacterium]|nr:sulfatase [Candidatus Dormibacteraeota bacterium]
MDHNSLGRAKQWLRASLAASSSRRLVVVLGEGAAIGLFIGSVLGGWEVWLNSDLSHRMLWLATHRLAGPMARGAAWGALASAALAMSLGLLVRRGRRPLRIGIVCLGLLWIFALAALAFPLRETVFLLHRFSSHGLTWTVFGSIAAASLLLLAGRSRDALSRAGDSGAFRRAPAVLQGLRLVIPVLAAAASGIVLVLWILLPRLSAARASGRPSVILVSLDTLRADRLGALRSARPRTPVLDGFATEGMVFEQAMSAAPWTLPAHASLFASLLPFDQRRHWDYNREVPLGQTLLAERLSEAGYRTAAFTGGGYVSAQCGFGQGFEIYEDHDELIEGGPETIAAAALAWVRRVRGAPFFLFVHTYEPHFPYVHADFANPADAGRLPPVVSYKEVDAIHRGDLILSEAERRYVTDLYDGDVAHADRVMGGFLLTLEREGILDRALLVVLSDHGEELWDREPDRSPDHGHSLYQELIHVPLLMRWPGRVPAGSRIRTPVSLIDLAPTLLALTGLPPEPAHEGRSLARTLQTGEEPPPRSILAEAVEFGPDRFMIRNGDLKVVLTPYPSRFNIVPFPARPLEVFDLADDPLERHDLSAHLTKPVAEMVDVLWRRARNVLSGQAREEETGPALPEELLQQLRSLGYLH